MPHERGGPCLCCHSAAATGRRGLRQRLVNTHPDAINRGTCSVGADADLQDRRRKGGGVRKSLLASETLFARGFAVDVAAPIEMLILALLRTPSDWRDLQMRPSCRAFEREVFPRAESGKRMFVARPRAACAWHARHRSPATEIASRPRSSAVHGVSNTLRPWAGARDRTAVSNIGLCLLSEY